MADEKQIHLTGHEVTITLNGEAVDGYADAAEFFKLTPEEEAESNAFRKHVMEGVDDYRRAGGMALSDIVKVSTSLDSVTAFVSNHKHRRKCLRCDEPSIEPSGIATTGKLCRQHAKERRDRQTKGRTFPKCRCGGTAAKGQPTCRSCADQDEARKATAQSRELFGKALKRLREIVGDLEFCCSPSAYCAELEEIADTLEEFR
jgi:hypothetical protein